MDRMRRAPEIEVARVRFGCFPEAASLNPRIAPGTSLLSATLDIRWDDPDPVPTIANLEQGLLAFSPSFSRHDCRGPRAYHILLGGDGVGAAAMRAAGRASPLPEAPVIDGGLALAHVIEHVMIDFLCAITDERRCSGVTGAHRNRPGRFDLLVECPDCSVGRFSLALAVTTVTSAILGKPPGPAEREILAAARLAHRHPDRPFRAPAVARALGWTERRAASALAALQELGYLEAPPWTVNLSGIPEYRVTVC